jgi:uncharacterized OB-fold protein
MTETTPIRPFSAASFDQYIAEQQLMLTHCTQCNTNYAPPRAICPKCHSDQLVWSAASGKGTLAAFTVIYTGPTFMVEQGFDRKTPYVSGIVALDEGTSISARITGIDPLKPEAIQIGTPLTVDFVEFAAAPSVTLGGTVETRKTYLAFKTM